MFAGYVSTLYGHSPDPASSRLVLPERKTGPFGGGSKVTQGMTAVGLETSYGGMKGYGYPYKAKS